MGFTGASVTPVLGLKERCEAKARAQELAEMRASFGPVEDDEDEDECDSWEREARDGYL